MKAKKSESSSPAPKARGRSLARGEERALREVCAFIDAHCDSGEPLRLDALAKRAGFSASSLRRLFRRELGVTPRQYVEARRFERLRSDLRGEGERSITDSIYQAGFASPSRVYEQTGERLGMTLSEYRAGGRGVEISYALVATEFGPLMIAATDRGLCSVRFADAPDDADGRRRLEEDLRGEFPEARIEALEGQASGEAAREPLGGWIRALEEHLRGERPSLDLPLDVRASAFRQRVWRSLQTIPSGETRSYREVAAAIGQPRAARAVAGACAANPVALVIPCHRVIRSGGELGGYRWGEGRKRDLLERERRAREARE